VEGGAMRQLWSADELGEHWTLLPEDLAVLIDLPDAGKLGLAAQLTYWRQNGRFPGDEADLAPAVIGHLATQVGVGANALDGYDWIGRTGRRHRRTILAYLAVADFDDAAEAMFRRWLAEDLLLRELASGALEEQINGWFARERVTRPGAYRLDRILRSAGAAYDDAALHRVAERLDAGARERLDTLLTDNGEGTAFARLTADPGRVSLESLLAEIGKLELFRSLALLSDLLHGLHPNQVKRFRRRAAIESTWELRRHPERIRLPLLAFYCVPREGEVVDGLVELLIQITHRITVKAERRVVEELVEEAREVRGKAGILFRVAEAAVGQPDGVVREVIFPIVGAHTFEALIREAKALGTPQSRRVHTAVRASYGSYYRRMMPKLMATLEFRSNNGAHRPLLDALEAIRRAEGEGRQFFRADEIAIDGVIRPKWRDIVIEDAPGGGQRVNRINYEICALQTLRDRLRCKEIWVVGANRFCNPDDDLPADFAERRAACYEHLSLPTDARAFTEVLKAEMADALTQLDKGMPRNAAVRLDPRRQHPIVVSPLEPQPEPTNLEALKVEIGRRWPMIGLLDILKETDLRVVFTEAFSTAATREATDHDEVRRRLLLCLYGLGTNAGLKRLAVGRHGFSYKELLHTRRRYIDADALRDATRRVVNATLIARHPRIWGEGTTACASDSKHFGAFDQNLMTEWHVRYGGRGVMIYWHVERGSVCIHSRLRRCSSSEVAAMIEGVLRHDTEMEVERQYVDSHGQSEVAFAFCRLLGFQLLPRLKAIAAQRLYFTEAADAAGRQNLACILARAIDWELIERQYDEMVRYTTAMAERTADPETILRRFTRGNVQHPTYKALAELGKAAKTLFLCRYLHSEALRREIHEGLNVVETWNSANGFIFFGKGGEVASNRLDDQEVCVHALHLLQSCLVYVNTLMLQRVLAEPAWLARMTPADARALTPLMWGHVSPYGAFDLDMEQRLDLELRDVA
jgi:TnpA family transposase